MLRTNLRILKRQANILSSIINNFQTVEDVIETSSNASGSALAENEKYLKALESLTKEDINAFEEDGSLPKAITDVVTLSPNDMKFYFVNIPDMTPTTGGYIFDDIKLDMSEHGIETEKVIQEFEEI